MFRIHYIYPKNDFKRFLFYSRPKFESTETLAEKNKIKTYKIKKKKIQILMSVCFKVKNELSYKLHKHS